MHAERPSNLILLDLMILTILREENKLKKKKKNSKYNFLYSSSYKYVSYFSTEI
jgi:hypothetical protein